MPDQESTNDLQPENGSEYNDLPASELHVLDEHTQNKLRLGSAVTLRTLAGMLDISVQALQFNANRCPEAKHEKYGYYDLNALLRHKLNRAEESAEGVEAKTAKEAAQARKLEADASHKEMVAAERAGVLIPAQDYEEAVLRMAHILATCLTQFPNRHADELLNKGDRIDVVEVLSAGTHAALTEISNIVESALLRSGASRAIDHKRVATATQADGGYLGGHAPDATQQHGETGQVEVSGQSANGADPQGGVESTL